MRKIESLRKKIAELQAERDTLSAQKRSRAEVEAIVGEQIAHLHAKGTEALAVQVQRLAAGQPAQFVLSLEMLVALVGVTATHKVFADPLSVIPASVPTSDRLERLQSINAELDALETAEEEICVSDGIERRENARAEIILG